ncbi:MAG: hypothetical protein MJ252_11155 [archaeon]|nr:hypothetical protein [archaeon]
MKAYHYKKEFSLNFDKSHIFKRQSSNDSYSNDKNKLPSIINTLFPRKTFPKKDKNKSSNKLSSNGQHSFLLIQNQSKTNKSNISPINIVSFRKPLKENKTQNESSIFAYNKKENNLLGYNTKQNIKKEFFLKEFSKKNQMKKLILNQRQNSKDSKGNKMNNSLYPVYAFNTNDSYIKEYINHIETEPNYIRINNTYIEHSKDKSKKIQSGYNVNKSKDKKGKSNTNKRNFKNYSNTQIIKEKQNFNILNDLSRNSKSISKSKSKSNNKSINKTKSKENKNSNGLGINTNVNKNIQIEDTNFVNEININEDLLKEPIPEQNKPIQENLIKVNKINLEEEKWKMQYRILYENLFPEKFQNLNDSEDHSDELSISQIEDIICKFEFKEESKSKGDFLFKDKETEIFNLERRSFYFNYFNK